jgi:DNA-binding IclR family transcriptional regulator
MDYGTMDDAMETTAVSDTAPDTTAATATAARSAAIRTAIDTAQSGPPGAVEKSMLVLDTLPGDGSSIGVSEVARRTGLPKTTVHRILGLLADLDLADHDDYMAGYRLGRRIVDLVRETPCMRTARLRDRLLPYLLDLYRMTEEAVHLGVLRDHGILVLERLYGHRSAPLSVRAGTVLPAHCTALGKTLLAHTDDTGRDRWITDRLTAYTPRTLRTGEALTRDLSLARKRGYAVDSGEYRANLVCLAAPVWGRGRIPVAAVSVSGPADRMDLAEVSARLRHVTNAASRSLRLLAAAAS